MSPSFRITLYFHKTEVEERVELHICSPSGPSWPGLGRPLPLPLVLPSCVFPAGFRTNPVNTVTLNKTNKNAEKNCICRKDLIYYSTRNDMRMKNDSKTLFQEPIKESFSRMRVLIFSAISPSSTLCIFLK